MELIYVITMSNRLISFTVLARKLISQCRRHISVVPQEPVLFSGTLAENIAYGAPRATQQQILAAARRANCDFMGDFPDGLDTEVGPRGAQLSGGQKQVKF